MHGELRTSLRFAYDVVNATLKEKMKSEVNRSSIEGHRSFQVTQTPACFSLLEFVRVTEFHLFDVVSAPPESRPEDPEATF